MLWLWASAARAHRPGVSSARVDDSTLVLTFSLPELRERMPLASRGDADAARDGILSDAHLSAGEVACALDAGHLELLPNQGVQVSAAHDCPPGSSWTLDAGYLDRFEPGHRHSVEAWEEPVAVLQPGDETATFAVRAPSATVASAWVRMGVEHIAGGADHLVFLLGLLLAARSLREATTIVTGFTVSHSITLALAALGMVQLSPDVVEPAIALSIVWVGLENLWHPPASRRFLVTMALGLVHGFGFAGLLAEVGLPAARLPLTLLSFNVGVELGQFLFVAALFPVLWAVRRWSAWDARLAPALSIGVAVAGLSWFLSRVL